MAHSRSWGTILGLVVLGGCPTAYEPMGGSITTETPAVAVGDALIEVLAGQSFNLYAEISGGTGNYAYQWRIDGHTQSVRKGGAHLSWSFTNAELGEREVELSVDDGVSVFETHVIIRVLANNAIPEPVVIVQPPTEPIPVIITQPVVNCDLEKFVITGGVMDGDTIRVGTLGTTLEIDVATALSGPDGPYHCRWYNAERHLIGSGPRCQLPADQEADFFISLEIVDKLGRFCRTVDLRITIKAVSHPHPDPDPPTVDLSFHDDTDTLSWTSTRAENCQASGPGSWNGSRPVASATGGESISQNGAYSITCSGPGGSAADTVTVDSFVLPPSPCDKPVVTLVADRLSVTVGERVTLTLTVTHGGELELGCTPAIVGFPNHPAGLTITLDLREPGTYEITARAVNACGSSTIVKVTIVVVAEPEPEEFVIKSVVFSPPAQADGDYRVGETVVITITTTGPGGVIRHLLATSSVVGTITPHPSGVTVFSYVWPFPVFDALSHFWPDDRDHAPDLKSVAATVVDP